MKEVYLVVYETERANGVFSTPEKAAAWCNRFSKVQGDFGLRLRCTKRIAGGGPRGSHSYNE